MTEQLFLCPLTEGGVFRNIFLMDNVSLKKIKANY
jgi:hypothetical protein